MTKPRYSPTEILGVNAVERISEQDLGLIFRPQPKDVGIDAQLELREVNPTGKLIGAQIKTGRSHFKERENDFLYYGTDAHVEYWLMFSLPVILIGHFPDINQTLWVHVTQANVVRTGKTWRISIPKAQVFGRQTNDQLRVVFNRAWREKPVDIDADALTGLANRRAMDRHLKGEMAMATQSRRPISLIAMDVDGFKTINDQHGHVIGDHVLRQVAKRLQSSIGRRRSLIARSGGDEFLVSLPGKSLKEAIKVAESVRNAIAEAPFLAGATPVRLTASLGVSSVGQPLQPGSDTELDSMLWKADAACYQAKRAGRNCVRASA